MKLIILSRKAEVHSTRRLKCEASHWGDVQVLDPESDEVFHTSSGLVLLRLGHYRYREAFEKLKKTKHFFFNSISSYEKTRNKIRLQKIFEENHFPTPATWPIPHTKPSLSSETLQWIEKIGWPLVVKKTESSQGVGVYLARDYSELVKLLSTILKDEKELLFQKMHEECWGKDLRLFVVGKKIWSIERTSTDGDFRSNLSLGGIAHPAEPTEEEKKLALSVTQTLGLDYAGVDLLRSQRGPLLLEANPCPGLEGIEKCLQFNLAQEILIHAVHRFQIGERG